LVLLNPKPSCFGLTWRSAAVQLGVDLSGATQWVRFLELHYDREGTTPNEVTVLMVPSVADLAALLPTAEVRFRRSRASPPGF
jgi:hypothetical protein